MHRIEGIDERVKYCLVRGVALKKQRDLKDYAFMLAITAACILAGTQAVIPVHHVSFSGFVAAAVITRAVAGARPARFPGALAIAYAFFSLLAAGQLDEAREWIWFALITAPIGFCMA